MIHGFKLRGTHLASPKTPTEAPIRGGSGLSVCLEVTVPDHNALVSASVAAEQLRVSIAVVCMWRNKGWIDPESGERRYLEIAGKDGRSKLYRWGDLLIAERDTRSSPQCRRPRLRPLVECVA